MRVTFAFLLLLSGCVTSLLPGAMAISDVWARHHELDGQVIRVSGYVYGCWRLDCQLSENRGHRAKSLGIAGSAEFDKAIVPLIGRQIVIEAQLNSNCLHLRADKRTTGDTILLCADRINELNNPKIVSSR